MSCFSRASAKCYRYIAVRLPSRNKRIDYTLKELPLLLLPTFSWKALIQYVCVSGAGSDAGDIPQFVSGLILVVRNKRRSLYDIFTQDISFLRSFETKPTFSTQPRLLREFCFVDLDLNLVLE